MSVTAKKLIEVLRQLPPDARIAVEGSDGTPLLRFSIGRLIPADENPHGVDVVTLLFGYE
jgi:hypothetical protein